MQGMAMPIDFSDAPADPIERLIWLSGARDSFHEQIEPLWQKAYFDARMTGRFDEAEALGLHAHKRIMAYTRHENEKRGRMIRWGDRRG